MIHLGDICKINGAEIEPVWCITGGSPCQDLSIAGKRAAWRAARAMGYKRLVTYILDSESGTSLKASGWKCVGQAGGLRWTGKRRPEVDLYPAQMKIRWEKEEQNGPAE